MLRLIWRCYSKDIAKNYSKRELFDVELLRQMQSNKYLLEKITVEYRGLPKNVTLEMDKHISTPLDCAAHIDSQLVNNSVLALVNNEPYDIRKPLIRDCTISFLNFRSVNPMQSNLAHLRGCSFLTNWSLVSYLPTEFQINICSFPVPDTKYSTFICDVQLLHNGNVSFDPCIVKDINLSAISQRAQHLAATKHHYQPLIVSREFAMDVFRHSPFKLLQVPLIAERYRLQHGSECVSLYKVGDHVDICQGPLIPDTSFIGLFKLTCIYPIETRDYGRLYRVQGVAVPKQLPTAYTYFEVLSKRASVPNSVTPLPQLRSSAKIKSMIAKEFYKI